MADGQGRTALITGFSGENYHHAESLLPPNVSPDALNCDYSRGTVRKRNGYGIYAYPSPTSHADSLIVGIHIDSDFVAPYSGSGDVYTVVAYPNAVDGIDISVYDWMDLVTYMNPFADPVPMLANATVEDANVNLQAQPVTEWNSVAFWRSWKMPNLYALKIEPLDVSGVTFTLGVPGGTNIGKRVYRIVARNSSDGHESDLDYSDLPYSAQTYPVDWGGVQTVTLNGIPTSPDPQVDKLRIYATKMNGSVFYYLADIDNPGSGTTTYEEGATDDELTVPYNSYRGALPDLPSGVPLLTPILWQERLWALGYEDGDYVLKWSERDYGDGLPLYCLFYPDNYISLRGATGVPLEIKAITDSYLLVACQNGLFAIVGNSPDDYRCIPVIENMSFFSIAVSETYCYAFGSCGVFRFPKGALGPVENISVGMEPIFEKVAAPSPSWMRYPIASYIPFRGEVWFCASMMDMGAVIETRDWPLYDGIQAGVRFTVVWNEKRQTWALHDIPVDAVYEQKSLQKYVSASDHSTYPVVFFGSHGLLCNTSPLYGYADAANEAGTVVSVTSSTQMTVNISGLWSYKGLRIRCNGQERIIDSRSLQTIVVTEAWNPVPSAGDTYTIGAIDWYWTAPRLALTDDRFAMKRTHRLKTAFDTESSEASDAVTVEYRFDDNTVQSKTLDASERHQEIIADDVGREFRLKYSNAVPGESVEIEGIQIELEMQE